MLPVPCRRGPRFRPQRPLCMPFSVRCGCPPKAGGLVGCASLALQPPQTLRSRPSAATASSYQAQGRKTAGVPATVCLQPRRRWQRAVAGSESTISNTNARAVRATDRGLQGLHAAQGSGRLSNWRMSQRSRAAITIAGRCPGGQHKAQLPSFTFFVALQGGQHRAASIFRGAATQARPWRSQHAGGLVVV